MRTQREGAQLQIRGTWSAGPGDDQSRFLADLRALRDSAVIGYDELAARAHYPSDVLKEAENGPYLPGLPILTAYVRACEGNVLDWEERWRRLNPEVANDPDLPVRLAGASPAAVAGARAGVGVSPPDVYDPERIKAALRGDRSGQDSRRANDQGSSALARGAARAESSDQDLLMDSGASRDSGASWGTSSGWDTPADPGITSANGNHPAKHASRGPFDAAFTVLPDPAEHAEPAQDQDFSWLDKSQGAGRRADAGARRHRTDTAASGRRPDVTGTDGFLGPRSHRNGRISGPSRPPQPRPPPTCSGPRRRRGPRSRRSRRRPGPRPSTPQRLRRQNPLSGPRPTPPLELPPPRRSRPVRRNRSARRNR